MNKKVEKTVCYLCGCTDYKFRKGKVRDNDKLKILQCNSCGLVFLSSQVHIQEHHYEKSGMHDRQMPDVDSWLKDTKVDDERRYQLLKQKITNKNVLDFGCGAGGFLALAKSSADKVNGIELEESLQPSFNDRGLNVFTNLQEAIKSGEKWDLITAFHVVEHLADPITVLQKLSNLIISVEGGGV